jgi:hypothetical protein
LLPLLLMLLLLMLLLLMLTMMLMLMMANPWQRHQPPISWPCPARCELFESLQTQHCNHTTMCTIA